MFCKVCNKRPVFNTFKKESLCKSCSVYLYNPKFKHNILPSPIGIVKSITIKINGREI